MINKYLTAIQELYANMKSGTTDFTFTDFLTTIGLSLTLALTVAAIIALMVMVAAGPFKIYHMMIDSLKKERNTILTSKCHTLVEHEKAINDINKRIKNRVILFILSIIFIYLPVAIPTVLYICYLVFHV